MPLPTTINNALLGMQGLVPRRLTEQVLRDLNLWNVTREQLAALLGTITGAPGAEAQGFSTQEWNDLQSLLSNWNALIEVESGVAPQPGAPVGPTGTTAPPEADSVVPTARPVNPRQAWNDAIQDLGHGIRSGAISRRELPQVVQRLEALYPAELRAHTPLATYLDQIYQIYALSFEQPPPPGPVPPPPPGGGGTPGGVTPTAVPEPPGGDFTPVPFENRDLAQSRFQRALNERFSRREISPFDYRQALQNFGDQFGIYSLRGPLTGQATFQDYQAQGRPP